MNKSQNNIIMILGNQLFPLSHLKKINCRNVFMAEDFELCTYFKHHKLKIFMFLKAMREYRDNLIKNGFTVYYYSIKDKNFKTSYEKKLSDLIKSKNFEKLIYYEIEDKFFDQKIKKLNKDIELVEIRSPMFLISRESFREFSKGKNFLLMASFYQKMRRKFNILIDKNQKPVGGKWSFDMENRKKIPKNFFIPKNLKIGNNSNYYNELKPIILKFFSSHPGEINNLWIPTNRSDALKWIDHFIEKKFIFFGNYEDAISKENNFLFHSCLSPMLNLGIITPDDILDKISKVQDIPLNSYEGFIRQILGWREFIRGIYHEKGDYQVNKNFWNHKRKLNSVWYEGNTNILPLDDAIKNCLKFGYTHHIPRLMLISNIMNLCRIHPKYIYKWFMEMFVDSSDWVMTPNVYGMGTFSDGGIFSTKPYLCGSNYILKMSDYKKDEWCDVLDGLYWLFVNDNKKFFLKQPRLNMMIKTFENISTDRKEVIFCKAKNFIERVSN